MYQLSGAHGCSCERALHMCAPCRACGRGRQSLRWEAWRPATHPCPGRCPPRPAPPGGAPPERLRRGGPSERQRNEAEWARCVRLTCPRQQRWPPVMWAMRRHGGRERQPAAAAGGGGRPARLWCALQAWIQAAAVQAAAASVARGALPAHRCGARGLCLTLPGAARSLVGQSQAQQHSKKRAKMAPAWVGQRQRLRMMTRHENASSPP